MRGKWKEISRQGDLTCTAIRDSVNGNNGKGIHNPEPLAFNSGDVLKKFQGFVHDNQIDRIKRDDLAELEKKIVNIFFICSNLVISLYKSDINALPLSDTTIFGILYFKNTLSTKALAVVSAVQSIVGIAIAYFVRSHEHVQM